jgi:hypothetical protein
MMLELTEQELKWVRKMQEVIDKVRGDSDKTPTPPDE